MGKNSKAPAAPDPYATASAESQFNRLDTYSPSGSGTRYGYTDPATGKFTPGMAPQGAQSAVTYNENPWEKAIRQALEPASVDLTKRVVTDNIANMPNAPRVQDRGTVAKSIFDRNMSLMKPGMDQASERLLTNLQARGLPVGGEAFNEALGAQSRQTNDAMMRMAMDADIAAGGEQSRLYGLDQASRQGAISELVAAMTGNYNPQNPIPSGNGAGVDYSRLVGQKYDADMAQYQQNQQNKGAAMSTIGGLAGAMIMKCSKDFKDIDPRAADLDGLADAVMNMPVQRWRYKLEYVTDVASMDDHIGCMAEDFHAATGLGDGKSIHVIDAIGVMMGALQAALRRIQILEQSKCREAMS